MLNQALDAGKTVLFEGGQATMLDVDHGTYPFVTSSNATAGGACTGSGVAADPHRPRDRRSSRRTRPASATGPFPTELLDESASSCAGRLRVRHDDRPPAPLRLVRRRRSRRYAARINGVTDFVLTKLDVLTGLEKIPVCVAYDVDGVALRRDAGEPDRLPPRDADLRGAPRLDRGHLRLPQFDDLPKNAQDYVRALEAMSGSRISAIGVGPERTQIVQL